MFQEDFQEDSVADSDCAVGVFSDTFSLQCQHCYLPIVLNAPATRPTMKTSIATSFPAEMLLMIFKLVYYEDCYVRLEDGTVWPVNHNKLSPSLFPYSIAAVCSYWRDIMALAPEFWTSIVILVDEHATPLPAVECQLSWSRDLPLDIVVTRRANTYTAEDKDEAMRTHQVISCLLPHLHRFRNLSFNVMHSSSLPSFLGDFTGSAPLLECLKLQCMEDDGGAPDSDAQNRAPTTSLTIQTEPEGFQCPALRDLTIDGRNFYNAGRLGPSWSGMLSSIQSLTVSHFKPRDDEKLTICDLIIPLNPIQHLRDLALIDLSINIPAEPCTTYDDMHQLMLPELERLTLHDLIESPNSCDHGCFVPLNAILTAAGPSLRATSITRCMTAFVREFEGRLSLEGLGTDLWKLLQCWYGTDLWVTSCPGFDDDALDDIGDCGSMAPCAPNLHTLVIFNCPNISAKGLKRLVKKRRSNPEQYPLREILISGDVPLISWKDWVWFSRKLRWVGYHGPECGVDSDEPDTDSDGSVYESEGALFDAE